MDIEVSSFKMSLDLRRLEAEWLRDYLKEAQKSLSSVPVNTDPFHRNLTIILAKALEYKI